MFETLGRGARWACILLTVATLTLASTTHAVAADVQATIDFDVEALPKGTIVSQIYGDAGLTTPAGPITVLGTIPGESGNRALIFDSSLRTGGDTDLGTPHQDFGGSGIGSGGQLGAPYQNDTAQHRVLILAENLIDADGDGLIDSPDDAVVYGMLVELDFTTIQAPFVPAAVSVHEITTIDAEGSNPGEVRFYDAQNQLIATTTLIAGGNNGRVTQSVGLPGIGVFGVARMEFQLNGSSALDDVKIELHSPAAPPVCEISESGPISVAVGTEVCFDVTGSTTGVSPPVVPPIDPPLCSAVTTVGQFQVEFLGVSNNSNGTSTWDYTVTRVGPPPALSHFTIELCPDAEVASSSPAGASVGPDGSTGTFGIKWEFSNELPLGAVAPFSFTLDQTYPVENVTFAAKAGTDPNFGLICGPSLISCSKSEAANRDAPF